MEPIAMPDSWHGQFVGIRIHTGHQFRISKTALTNSMMQFANYAIDIGNGIVLKNRYGLIGQCDGFQWGKAKHWPIVHDRKFGAGILRALERADIVEGTRYESVTEEREWEPEVICAPPSLVS